MQLAMRSGVYKYLNADLVYEGELIGTNKLTGDIDLSGTKASDTVVGYFAYIETVNGFRKTMYMSKEDMQEHGKKYSASYGRASSPWKKEFDGMAKKTMLRALLGKYGLMTVDMADGMALDTSEAHETAYNDNANSNVIDIDTGEVTMPDQATEEPPIQEERPSY